MKKIILIITLTIILTGCSATYDIEINKDKINDSIKIYDNNKIIKNANENQIEKFEDTLAYWQRGHEFYNRELYTTDQITGYNFTYSFDYNEYDAMSQIRKCYDNFELTNKNDTVSIKTSNNFLCADYYEDVNDITITITSKDYKIIKSNADTKNENKHIWKINKNNYNNKPIEIELNKNEKFIQTKEKRINIKAFATIFIFITLVLIFIRLKKKEK